MMGAVSGMGGRHRLVIGAILLLGLVALPTFISNFHLFIASTILALGLYAASYDLLYGYTGLLSFGHSVFFGVGAYGAALSIADHGAGPLLALGIALVVSAVVAVGLGVVAVRVVSHGFVIVTILLALMAHLMATSWSDITGGTDGIPVVVPPVSIPGLGEYYMIEPAFGYYFVLVVLLASLVLLWRLVTSPIGLAFKMIRENEQRAQMLGYNTTTYKLASFVVSGMFGGLAGALYVYTQGFVSAADFEILLAGDAVIFTLVGGRATLFGPVFGAVLVQTAELQLRGFTDAYPLFVGLLLVLIVVTEPDGLVGIYRRLKDRLRRTSSDSEDLLTESEVVRDE